MITDYDIHQMRDKLQRRHPFWNVAKMNDRQVIAIYNKELRAISQKAELLYGKK